MTKKPICWIVGHKYLRVRYPESPDGYFLRCRRCQHERDEPGAGSALAAGIGDGG